MFKNLRDKLAVLALIALGLAFGHAWSSQAQVQHDVIKELRGDTTCSPEAAVDAVKTWISTDKSIDALFNIAIYNMTGQHSLKGVPLRYTSSNTSYQLDSISDKDQEILSFLFAVKDAWGVVKFKEAQTQFKTAVQLLLQGNSCSLGNIIGIASCLSAVRGLKMPQLTLKRKEREMSYEQTILIGKKHFYSFVDYVLTSEVRHDVTLTNLMKSIYKELMYSSKKEVIEDLRKMIANHFNDKSKIKVVSEAKDIRAAFSEQGCDNNKIMVICCNDQGSLSFSNWMGRSTANKLVLVVHKGNVSIAHFGPITM